MYSNKKIMNNFPMKKLVPFFSNSKNNRRYSYTDGMSLRNEERKSIQSLRKEERKSTQSQGVPTTAYIEKLQKKLIQVLETNCGKNKKKGKKLQTSDPSSSIPRLTTEQKRSAAIHVIRKRTSNPIIEEEYDTKDSGDENILPQSKNNNGKVVQRQQALSVLMKRVNHANVKNNDNSRPKSISTTDLRRLSYDSLQTLSSNNNNSVFSNNCFEVLSPIQNPYYSSLLNYDMVNNATSVTGTTGSPTLKSLNAYDMNSTNNVSNTLSPITPSSNFMNSIASTSRKSINLGSVGLGKSNNGNFNNPKLFENNLLITNDLSMFDIASCPTSPLVNMPSNGSSFFNANTNTSTTNNNCFLSDESSKKIEEDQMMYDYLLKLWMNGGNGEVNEKEASLFSNNTYNTSKLPTVPGYLSNDVILNDITMQTPFNSSSSSNNSSPLLNESSPSIVGRNGSQTFNSKRFSYNIDSPNSKRFSFNNNDSPNSKRFSYNDTLNYKRFSYNDSPASINNLPSPYANSNKIITSNLAMPSSPYLGNASINVASPYNGGSSNNNNSITNMNELSSPTSFNIAPIGSPYLSMGLDKSQPFNKRSSFINLMGIGMPSPSPSISNGNMGNNGNNSRFMINNASSPYPVTGIDMGDMKSIALMSNDNPSYIELPQTKFNSKSMPTSPSIGYNEPNLFQTQMNNNNIPSVMEQRSIFNNNQLNAIIPPMYNSTTTVQMSQSKLPAYSSTSNKKSDPITSPNIGAIGPPSTTKLIDDEEEYTNPLTSFAFEKQKKNSPLNDDYLSDEFAQLSLRGNNKSKKLTKKQKYLSTSALLSSSIISFINNNNSNNTNNNINDNELFIMKPKSKTLELNISIDDISTNSDPKHLNINKMDSPFKMFNNKPDLVTLNNFESSNARPNQSFKNSPIINSIGDKNFNPYNIDIQMASDAFSNNSNSNSNNSIFSLSLQHPILS